MQLSCPQCGLVLALTALQTEYCPRCLAKRRQPVPLVAEALERMQREAAESLPRPSSRTERAAQALRVHTAPH